MSRYYEATGRLGEKVRTAFERHSEAIKRLKRLVKKVGGGAFGARSGGFGYEFSIQFNANHFLHADGFAKTWRRVHANGDFFRPKRSGPGKALMKELEEIERAASTGDEVEKAIGMDKLHGGSWFDAGFFCRDGRAMVSVHDGYKPPAKLVKSGEIKRVSDVDWEAFTADKPSKRKAKVKK